MPVLTSSVHVMVDIETAGSAPDAVILAIGAVTFGRDPGVEPEPFFELLHMGQQVAKGRSVDGDTLAWWLQQRPAVRDAMFSGARLLFDDVLQDFALWMVRVNATHIWCKGASFDFPILAHAYRQCGLEKPWNFRFEHDARTLYRLTGIKPVVPGGLQHDALADAKAQANAACSALEKLDAWERFELEGGK
jgi:hypothetical protein